MLFAILYFAIATPVHVSPAGHEGSSESASVEQAMMQTSVSSVVALHVGSTPSKLSQAPSHVCRHVPALEPVA